MVSQDRQKQERLLHLAGWLHHKHQFQTLVAGKPYSEVEFVRSDLDQIPALAHYGLARGDAGEKAFERDIQDLGLFGIEVLWSPARGAWISRITPLTDAERRALATAALAVIIEDGSSTPQGFHVPGAGITVEGAELVMSYAPETDLIVEAIGTRTPLLIEHRHRTRTIDPWHVFVADGRWYLVGRDHESDEERTFAMDAIRSVEPIAMSTGYEIPDRDVGSIARRVADPDAWTSAGPIDVELAVHPRLVIRAEELLGAIPTGDHIGTGWPVVACSVRNIGAFIDRLWGLRARAIVIGPPEVRSRIIETLEAWS